MVLELAGFSEKAVVVVLQGSGGNTWESGNIQWLHGRMIPGSIAGFFSSSSTKNADYLMSRVTYGVSKHSLAWIK